MARSSTCIDRDLYAEWAPHYAAEAHNPLMRVEQQAVMKLLPDPTGHRVVDAGCGTGRYARLLKDAGAASVIGIDRSAAMLSHACQCGATYVRADIRALPLPEMSADLIVSGLMLPDVDELGRVLAEWHRVLKPGGVIVCSTLHPGGAELGWTRTFDTPHGTRSIPAHWHTLDDHRLACREAGLITDAMAEPTLHPEQGDCESILSWLPPSGGSHGLASFFRLKPEATRWRVPVALVLRASRPRLP